MSLANQKEEGFQKVYVLGNNQWEQASIIRCIENDTKFLSPVDVSNNKNVLWRVSARRVYIVIIFAISTSEMNIPENIAEEPTIDLKNLSKRFIKETNEMCREIERHCEGEVYRLIVVPDGRLTPFPLALVGEQWNEEGLSKFRCICIHTLITL